MSSGGPDRVGPAKFLPVHRKQPVVVVRRREQIEFVDVGRGLAPTAAQGLTPPRPIDQDASHRLGRGAEKVRTIVPLRLLAGAEPRSGFTPRCSMPPTSNDSRNRGIPPSPSLRRDKKAPPTRAGVCPRPLGVRPALTRPGGGRAPVRNPRTPSHSSLRLELRMQTRAGIVPPAFGRRA